MRRTIALLLVVGLAACDTTATSEPGTTVPANAAPLTSELQSALQLALLDERHAQAIYEHVLADHGTVMPFANIVRAEGQHATAIEGLYRNRGLTVPTVTVPTADVPRFATLSAACAASADAEIANIALYDQFLQLSLPNDVRTVFTNNRRASVDNHLPAFTRCR
jgi:hypothetical protein